MVPFVSERRSAFTPDDLTAHAIGVRVARDVLQTGADLATYEQRTGDELELAIAALEPMEADALREFCSTLQGVWRSGTECLVADTNLGLRTGVKQPLVADETSREPVAGASIVWDQERTRLTYHFEVSGSVAAAVRAELGTTIISSDTELEQLVRAVGKALATRRTFAWSDELADDAASDVMRVAGYGSVRSIGTEIIETTAPECDESGDKERGTDEEAAIDQRARRGRVHLGADGDREASRGDDEPDEGFGGGLLHDEELSNLARRLL
jgi:hypothetical protein